MLPTECPGSLEDYTTVVVGSDDDDTFLEDQLDGQALVLGGAGDDWFSASPPGAGDCLLGGEGDDRFESLFESPASTWVGGAGADRFVLRGSIDGDAVHINDFKTDGADQIVLDAMVYGLSTNADTQTINPQEMALAPGFSGGNSTAGSTARILYNPDDGSVWYDSDQDGEVAEAVRIAVIDDFHDYQFVIDDWELE